MLVPARAVMAILRRELAGTTSSVGSLSPRSFSIAVNRDTTVSAPTDCGSGPMVEEFRGRRMRCGLELAVAASQERERFDVGIVGEVVDLRYEQQMIADRM